MGTLLQSIWKNSKLIALLVTLLLLATSERAFAADPAEGYWTTMNDDGKTATSVVRIFERDKKLYGNIVKLINPSKKDPKCDECSGAYKGKPIVGMQILWNLSKDGTEWSGGSILDPKNGKIYKCYIEVIDGGARLKVRGYIGISLLGRTQYWRRTQKPEA
jgi:uncharacterized protein (DUF2147 family)